MNELILYNKYGAVLFSIDPEESSSHDWSLMSENKLSVSFEREECTVLAPGCYVEFDGIRFYLLDEYKPRMINSATWKYDVAFLDAASWMSVVLAMNTIDGKNLPIFNYTGPAREHAEIIVANLNRYMGTTEWKVGTVLATPNIAIEYRGKYCSQILQEVVDVQNTEWWVDGMTLNIGRAEFGDAVELGYRNGLLGDISREQAAGQRAYAYLVPIGSTRNIDPTKYGYDRLQLPDGKVFIDINPNGVGELVEERAFAEIYPRYEGTVQYVRSRPAIGNDGNEFTIYYIGDMLPFNPNDYEIAGLVKRITFQSGELMGESFEVNYDADAQEFEIITQFPDGGQLPGGIFTPSVGDKYVIWNITMPDEYYSLASQEYLEAAEAFAESSVQDSSVYKGSLDYIDIQERGISVRPGRRVRLLSDEYFSKGYYDSRITRMTRRLWYPNEISIDVSAVRVVGSIARLDSSIQKTETQLSRLSGAQPTIIKSGEITPANDKAVYSSAKSEEEFLNKRKGGNVIGRADFITPPGFPAGAEFNGAVVRFDTGKKCWIFPFNVLVEGGIAWNTKLEGFEAQTITAAVQVDWKTIGKNEAGELCVIGYTGGGSGDGSGSGGVVGGVTIDEVKNYLTNEGYATQVWVNEQGFLKSITSAMVTSALSYTPFNTANFTKDNIKNALGISDWALESVKPSYKFSEITNKPTTLSGYGITDAYTKTQVDSALAKKWTQDDSLIANWNSAYSWGNHASAGYVKQSDITSEFSKYVTLSTAQTVTGIKDFANGLKVGGVSVTYNAAKNAFVLPANLLVEGGIAWNSKIDGFDVPTIMDAIQVDGDTISKDKGYLEFVGQTSGGGTADSVAWENVTGRPTKLSQFTNDSGFITSASLPTKLSQLTDDVVKGNYLPIDGIAVGAKTLKASATSSSWTVAAGNGINVYNNSSTQRYWFGFSLTEGSPYATTKWVFGASDGSYNAGGEIYAKHISLGYGESTTTGSYALRANGDAKIDGSLTLNGKIISYNASKNAFVFPANAIFEGGVAWNASIDGFTPQTIMDAIIVDDETISKANGYLEFIGETGGLDETELADYLTTNNYAKKSDIPSLSGYATQTWVTNKGYITSAAIPTKVSAFDNDSGYITGITSAMVTSALGYTSFNEANFTKANIKSTLGISDWALAATSPFKNLGRILSTDDLTALVTGIGYTQNYTPVEGAYAYGQIIDFNGTRGHTQIYISDGGAIYLRNDWNKTGLANRAWRAILTSSNYSNYALSLTTDQDVTGIKNFVNGVKVGGSKAITYDATEDAFIFPANILAEGGVAWNTKLEGFDQQTVTAAVSVDETTINRTTSGALQLNPTIAARIAALEARVEQLHPTVES